MSFWPRKILIWDIALNTLGALIAGFIGSIIILTIVFATSSIISIPATFDSARLDGWSNNPMFPFILSFITFFSTMISFFIGTTILHMTDPIRYKKSTLAYGQIWIFAIITYICITPIYIYTGLINYDYIMIVFIIHCIVLALGTSLILELLNNYRYILVGFYGSFIWVFFTSIMTVIIFSSVESGKAKLLSLLIILPLINTSLTLFKWIFEMLYYKFHILSNTDIFWDIFYRLEQEEQEILREEEIKNNL